MNNQEMLFKFIYSHYGQARTLTISTSLVKLLGDLHGGVFLGQLIFWSDKGTKPDGWFWKSYEEWEEETYLSAYHIKKWATKFEEWGWLETKLEKVNGAPTNHYRIDIPSLSLWIMAKLSQKKEENSPEESAQESAQNGVMSSRVQKGLLNFSGTIESEKFKNHITVDDTVNDNHSLENKIFSKTDEDFIDNTDQEIDDQDLSFRREQNEEWERIGSERKDERIDISKYEEIVKWSRKYKLLDSAPDDVKTVSYIFYQETGIEPSYPKKNWISACNELWQTAKQNERVLRKGLRRGEEERRKGTVTLTSPRSYKSYVTTVIARINKPDRPVVIDGNPEFSQPSKSDDPTQRVYKDETGRTVIKIG